MESAVFEAVESIVAKAAFVDSDIIYKSETLSIEVERDHIVDLFCSYRIKFLNTYCCDVSCDFEDNYKEYFYESGDVCQMRYIPMGKCLEILKKELLTIKTKKDD